MMTEKRVEVLSPSSPYLQSSIGFTYRVKEDRIFSITRILHPLNAYIWLTVLVMLLFTIIIILSTKKLSSKWRHFIIGGRKNRQPIVNTWLIVLGKAIPNPLIANSRYIGTFARTLMLLWILLWFFIRTWYEGALYTKLSQHRFSTSYDTIEKVLASDCKIITPMVQISLLQGIVAKNR